MLLSEFKKSTSQPDGCTAMCKSCIAKSREKYDRRRELNQASANAYYARNRDACNERNRAYRVRRGDSLKAAKREYYKNNQASIRASRHLAYWEDHIETCRKVREYYAKNRPTEIERSSRRRAQIHGATVGDPAEIRAFYKWARESNGVRCYYCSKRVRKSDRHVDHIIPLSRGGPHSLLNLCCACSHCNLTKNKKTAEEFCGQRELFVA